MQIKLKILGLNLITVVLLCAGCLPGSSFAQRIDLSGAFEQAMNGHAPIDIEIDLPTLGKMPARVETTSQGNGTLTIGVLSIRLMDIHDDGLVYANAGLLNLDVLPIEQPTFVVTGIVNETDEKTSVVLRQTPLLAVFRWDAHTKEFRCIYSPDQLLDSCATPVLH
ncbi:MAG TPA: hypothetical protein VGE55_11540 [Limnobacter sp.]|uniref:hypothetical protein n=1 Tax=Limnobacter sp. TaxID=2003368 RepID=UPI002ED7DFB4